MTHINDLKHNDMSNDPDNYFENKQAINFGIINNECRSDPVQKIVSIHQFLEIRRTVCG